MLLERSSHASALLPLLPTVAPVLFALGSSLAAAEDWRPAAPEAPLASAADVSETRWSLGRPPGGAHDRIGLHRYRGKAAPRATLLYLPGTNMNGGAALA